MSVWKHLSTFLALMALSGLSMAATPDYDREKRLTNEYVDALVVGDPIDLNDGKRDFIGIMTEAETDEAKGAVVILHGRGFHPAWPSVIQPIRTGLPENGWATFSLQMPVLGKDAKYYDYVPLFPEAEGRIAAGLKYLRDEGYKKVIVLAHSCGAHMAMSFVRKNGDKDFDAYIGVGMGATDYKQPMKQPFPIDKMEIPMLDIYGENDFPAVLRLAPERKAMMAKAGNAKSQQVVVKGADHYYGKAANVEALTKELLKWLGTL